MTKTKTGPTFRIIKDELPDGRGYRLTFEIEANKEPEKPLLPLDPRDPKYLEVIAGMTKKNLHEDDAADEPLFVYATDKGIELLQQAGTTWVVEHILKPHESEKPESEKKLIIGAKPCVILRMPKPAKRPEGSRLLGKELDAQDYLKRFGITAQVTDALQNITSQLQTFKLEPALEEYIAGKELVVREYREGSLLSEIKLDTEALMHSQDAGSFGMTKRQWMYWFEQFETETVYLRELFSIVGYEKGEPYTLADFSLKNWLCSGVDDQTHRPKLTLVDQHPNLLGTPDSVMDTDDMARSMRYRELMARYKDDGTLARLRK